MAAQTSNVSAGGNQMPGPPIKSLTHTFDLSLVVCCSAAQQKSRINGAGMEGGEWRGLALRLLLCSHTQPLID